ncbi:hypothetical protein [Dinghuibacter silviterrae]|nr:hypothetical protein [Dinghuibacter silviterrae]
MKRLAIALLVLAACHTKPKGLGYLEQYAGQAPGAIWGTEPLHSQLKDLLGDRYDPFVKDMAGAGALTKDKYLYTYATIDSGYAYILIDTHTDKIAAAIYTKAAIENFQSPGEAFDVPAVLKSQLDSLK